MITFAEIKDGDVGKEYYEEYWASMLSTEGDEWRD